MFTRLILLLTALGMAAFGALHGLGFMGTFNTTPAAALAGLNVAKPPPASDLERRVALVVVDGLRADKAALLGLESLGWLDTRCRSRTVVPSFSRPSYAALLTGTPPWATGVHNNDHEGAVGLGGIAARARSAGWATRIITDGVDWWPTMFPGEFAREGIKKKGTFDAWWAAQPPPADGSFTVLHLVRVDDEGHDHGGISEAYDAAARHMGSLLRPWLAHFDPARDSVIITSDHGHIDRGGHGGPEPVVMEVPVLAGGRGIREAAEGCEMTALDVAPTLAALLDTDPPPAALGQPARGLLLPEIVTAPAQRARWDRHEARLAPARRALISSGAGPRAPSWLGGALAIGLVVALALFIGHRLGRAQIGAARARAALALVLPAAFATLYALLEPTWSLSAVWEQGPWTLRMVALLGAAVGIAAVVRWASRRRVPLSPQADAIWLLWAAIAPVLVAVSVHGSTRGGPVLGDPNAAFMIVLADLVLVTGALVAALLLVGSLLWGQRADAKLAGAEPGDGLVP